MGKRALKAKSENHDTCPKIGQLRIGQLKHNPSIQSLNYNLAHSLSSNAALALIANGTVYTRWYGWAIIPRNVLGASCSFFTGLTGAVQFGRRQHYEMYIQGEDSKKTSKSQKS